MSIRAFFSLFFIFFISIVTVGQNIDVDTGDTTITKIRMPDESFFQDEIALEEVFVFAPLRFHSNEERIRYYILRRKTWKVYPYAKLAAERLQQMNRYLDSLPSRSLKKKYIKRCQKYIEGEFEDELKKLTRTEGQILIKLIHRQTGSTAYELIKELRSGWNAFWYNTTASMFDLSLKMPYDPEHVEEDYLIEDILQRAFAANKLEKAASPLPYDYSELSIVRDSIIRNR